MRKALLTLAVALAIIMASFPVTLLSADPRFWPYLIIIIGSVTALTVILRIFPIPNFIVQIFQLLAHAGWLIWLGTGWAPDVGNWYQQLQVLAIEGGAHIQNSSTPMEPNIGTLWLLLVFISLLHITADLLAILLEQPAWVVAPIMMPYLIPAASNIAQVPWWQFATTAVAYALVLLAGSATSEQKEQNISSNIALAALGNTFLAVLITIPTLVFSLLISDLLPQRTTPDWENLVRSRPTLELSDPSIDIREHLNRPENTPLLKYRSSRKTGEYLRLVSLPKLTSSGAALTDVSVHTGALPRSVAENSQLVSIEVKIGQFASEYLPVPYAPIEYDTGDQMLWGWDSLTRSVLAMGENRKNATINLAYTATSMVPSPTNNQVAKARSGIPEEDVTRAIPDNVPPEITKLAKSITKGSKTAGQKALAIQKYLRSSKFKYSTTAPEGDGYDVLVNFLTKDKAGYCVHYATSMALLARVEGIPSRVAVGFLPGKKRKDGWWQVNSHDMHSWPELYLEGLGWVPFEPTAGTTTQPMPTTPTPVPTQQPTEVTTPSVEPEDSMATKMPKDIETPADDQEPSQSLLPTLLLAGLGVLVVIGIIATPHLIRSARRKARLNSKINPADQAIRAWQEVQATWLDLNGPLPNISARKTAALFCERTPAATQQVMRLVLAVEQARYAKEPPAAENFVEYAEQTIKLLESEQKWSRLLVAKLWPKSLWADLQTRLGYQLTKLRRKNGSF